MKKSPLTSLDPVCGMPVKNSDSRYATQLGSTTYHFCSAQCLERFTDSPALYTGARRLSDIRPIPKKHRLKFAQAPTDYLIVACQNLSQMMGVLQVLPGDHCLVIEYDLQLISLKQIERAVSEAGLVLQGGLHRLRRELWQFFEHNELDNFAHAGTGACCNRPPTRLR